MTKFHNFTLVYKEASGIETKKEISNVYEYGFTNNGDFFYTAVKPKLSEELPGKASSEMIWNITKELIRIEGLSNLPFNSLMERKEFIKNSK